MYSIFEKPLRRALRACMVHGGVGGQQTKSFKAEGKGDKDFRPISSYPGQDFDLVWVTFQVFSRQPAPNPGTRSNQGQKWIQHPKNRGIPCYQPLGPTFVDPKAWGLWGDKSRSQGLRTWHPPTLRVRNPFLALVPPSSKVLGVFGAENFEN